MKKNKSAVLPNALNFWKSTDSFQGSQALPMCPSDTSSLKPKMSMKHW